MELTVFARFHAKPGKQQEVLASIREVEAPTRLEAGCTGYQVFQSVRDPDEFYIHSRWADEAAFKFHAELPHTVRFIARVELLIDHPLAVSLTQPLP